MAATTDAMAKLKSADPKLTDELSKLSAEDLYELSLKYEIGEDGFPQDISKSIELLIQSSGKGHPQAISDLFWLYHDIFWLEKDSEAGSAYSKAVECQQQLKTITDKDNHLNSQLLLGITYFNSGVSSFINYGLAFEYFTKAAKQGSTDGWLSIGRYFRLKGEHEQSFLAYKHAADQGNIKAQLEVAICYLKAKGVTQNTKLGFALLDKLDKTKLPVELAEKAEGELALCYCYGAGTQEHLLKSQEHLRLHLEYHDICVKQTTEATTRKNAKIKALKAIMNAEKPSTTNPCLPLLLSNPLGSASNTLAASAASTASAASAAAPAASSSTHISSSAADIAKAATKSNCTIS